MALIKSKRIYEAPAADDGYRILVDRLWPRGIKKENAGIDLWFKDISPSNELRKWYRHDPEKWDEFQRRYLDEMESRPGVMDEFRRILGENAVVTLLFASKSTEINHTHVLIQVFG